MICSRCGKRLSRKTARQIGKEVLCSACMFAPADRSPKGQDRNGLDAKHESAVTPKAAGVQTL